MKQLKRFISLYKINKLIKSEDFITKLFYSFNEPKEIKIVGNFHLSLEDDLLKISFRDNITVFEIRRFFTTYGFEIINKLNLKNFKPEFIDEFICIINSINENISDDF